MGFLYARELLQDGLLLDAWRHKIITTAWIHLELISHIEAILRAANSVIVISGRTELREQMASRVGPRLEEFIPVPVQGFRPSSVEQSHFAIFPKVRERLSTGLSGKLVLVGAGLFGKVYCHAARQHGAVAIDLGSAFDVLAGCMTRPIHKYYPVDKMRWL